MNGVIPMVSVKTNNDIPKNKIAECIALIKETTVKAPISIGDIIIENVAGTHSNIVATKEIKKSA
jgi:CxxC motif-containing protein